MNKLWILVILIVALGTILGVTIFLRHEEDKKGQIVQAKENTSTTAAKNLSIKGEIENIISSFRKLGVSYVGPCHCSGDTARQLFKEEYGENFINVGVGRVVTMNDLR